MAMPANRFAATVGCGGPTARTLGIGHTTHDVLAANDVATFVAHRAKGHDSTVAGECAVGHVK